MQQTLRRDLQKHFLEIFNCTRKEDTTYPRLSTENNQLQEILVKPIDFLKEKEEENKILWASEQKEQATYQRKRRRGDGGRSRGEERQAPQRPCDTVSQGKPEHGVGFPARSPATLDSGVGPGLPQGATGSCGRNARRGDREAPKSNPSGGIVRGVTAGQGGGTRGPPRSTVF